MPTAVGHGQEHISDQGVPVQFACRRQAESGAGVCGVGEGGDGEDKTDSCFDESKWDGATDQARGSNGKRMFECESPFGVMTLCVRVCVLAWTESWCVCPWKRKRRGNQSCSHLDASECDGFISQACGSNGRKNCNP